MLKYSTAVIKVSSFRMISSVINAGMECNSNVNNNNRLTDACLLASYIIIRNSALNGLIS